MPLPVAFLKRKVPSFVDSSFHCTRALIDEAYPWGTVVKNSIHDIGRISLVQASKNSSSGLWTYANSFSFNAAGAVTSMQLGNGAWEGTAFNSRMQLTGIALGSTPGASNLLDLAYTYNTKNGSADNPDNNGNVLTQAIIVDDVGSNPGFDAVQTYSYDPLNRIKTAEEVIDEGSPAAWTQEFTYDRYGNRNFNESTTTTLTKQCGTDPVVQCAGDKVKENPEIDKDTNRIKELQPDGDQNEDYEFDAAGNTILDPDGREFFYDGENKQITVKDISDNIIGEYVYDGDGRRVMKKVPIGGGNTETTVFVYDAGGKLVAEYSTTIASQSTAQVSYLTNDHLGSPRITTDKNGKVYSRRDFLPFGEDLEISVTPERTSAIGYGADSVRQKFTGYERDNETSLDYAQTRYFSYSLGRFSGPDSFLEGPSKGAPASWNLYVYTENNPLKYVDPTGTTIYVYLGGNEKNEKLIYREGELFYENGDKYEGDDKYARAVQNDFNRIREADDYASGVIDTLVDSDKDHYVVMPSGIAGASNGPLTKECTGIGMRCGSLISYDPTDNTIGPQRQNSKGGGRPEGPAFINLAHETWHAFARDQGIKLPNDQKLDTAGGDPSILKTEENEVYAVQFENLVRPEEIGPRCCYRDESPIHSSYLLPGKGNHITEKYKIPRKKAVVLTPPNN